MPNTQQLREQRANVWSQMQEVMALAEREGRDLSAEERSKYDAAELDLDRLGGDIERQERHEARERDFSKVDRTGVVGEPRRDTDPDDEKRYEQAWTSWVRRGTQDISSEERSALRTGWVDGSELRAAGVATASAGGYTVPPAFRAKLVEQMSFVAPMRQYAEVITTDTGANLPWPTVDDTANEGAILAENTQVSEQDFVFGQASLDAYMYTSKLVRVSFQLLNDNAFNLEAYLARALGQRIGRIQNRHFTVGTGTGQPDGIVTGATVGKVGATGQTTTVTYDDLVDLTDSIDLAYAGNQQFMMSQSARKAIRKLKDSQGRPLWEPSLQVGTPDTLLGYGIALNNLVPAPAASAKSILFGNFRDAYLIRDVSDVQLLRLQERYADFLQVGFLAFARADGTLQNASAVRAYQNSAT
jgi:HK97 family phage major capsid protein